MIESNLNAVCKTPRAHREELLSNTHRPHLQQIWYTPMDFGHPASGTKILRSLIVAWETIDIEMDPYVKKLRSRPLDGKALQAVLLTRKTYCNEQLRRFVDRSCHIFQELGGWAVDYFIHESIAQLRTKLHDPNLMIECDNEEKLYLVEFLSRIPKSSAQSHPKLQDFHPSPKLEALITFLTSRDEPEFSGLIFAKQRATVGVLAYLLSVHPLTKDRFRCAAYVGWSGGGGNRKDGVGDLLTMKMQQDTLSEFRSGQKNLIVATDVLEEGIDISACSLVICYDKPANVKSFVQRRGRARRKESTFAIMFSTQDEIYDLKKWQLLEAAMIEAYQNDERERLAALDLESNAEVVDERFEVESTGAVLTADTAVSHLYHFCSILPSQPYVDNRPEISFEYDGQGRRRGLVKLPNSVHPKVTRTEGQRWWTTERAATKEVAFHAYKRLYEFGLLNDNLLPLTRKPELRFSDFDKMPAMVEVEEIYDPWTDWAYSWASPDIHQSRILIRLNETDYQLCMTLTGPTVLPSLDPVTLFWDSDNIFTLEFDVAQKVPIVPTQVLAQMREITALYLQSPSSKQLKPERDFVTLFGPDVLLNDMSGWMLQHNGADPAMEVYTEERPLSLIGIVRDRSRYNERLLLKKWIVSYVDGQSVVQLECDPLPRRRNLLQKATLATTNNLAEEGPTSKKARTIPAEDCTVDKLPFSNAIFGLFISAILDRLEATLVATRLCETILQDVGFNGTGHVLTAITAPQAQGPSNYQRYEFFGDSFLKFTVSCQLYMQHAHWPEGYLSEGRDIIVQNTRLARAALETGLDGFIITKMFTPRKWAAPLISEKVIEAPGKRILSSKMLADVVEALIGAAYLEGGHEKAHRCLRRFLPEVEICPVIRPAIPEKPQHVMNDTLKKHLGYAFVNEALLIEALTHPSCRFDSSTQSYQRLEFLGDAVLDMVMVRIMSQHPVEYPQGDMTMIKHALVNGNLLGFLCMEFSMPQEKTEVDALAYGDVAIHSEAKFVELWRFMRSGALGLADSREVVLKRHRKLREEVICALHHGSQYPWQALSQLNADKYFSDIIESVIGAIFVDSNGDLDAAAGFIERLGLTGYLHRILSDGVDVTHPRNEAHRLSKGEVQFTCKRVPEKNGTATYWCIVKRKDTALVVVEGCLSSEEAEVKAANAALDILKLEACS